MKNIVVLGEDRRADARQGAVEVDVAHWSQLLTAVLENEGVRPPAEVGLAFVSRDEMATLNQQFMGSPGATDVLAFPLDDAPLDDAPLNDAGVPFDGIPRLVGDVVICPDVASKAITETRTLDDELALLVVHGALHLLGHDHAEPDERSVMQQREDVLLATFAPDTAPVRRAEPTL